MAKQIIKELLLSVQGVQNVYAEYRRSLGGLYALHLHGLETTQGDPQHVLSAHVEEVYKRYSDALRVSIASALKNASYRVSGAYAVEGQVAQYLSATQQTLTDKIESQMRSDAYQLTDQMRHFLLRVRLAEARDNVQRSHALVSERERVLTHKTIKRDTMGRARDARDYVNVEVHCALFLFYNTVALMEKISMGEEEAELVGQTSRQKFAIDQYMFVLSEIHPRKVCIVV